MLHFICPICKKFIRETSCGCICENGHSFDRAKEGYFNLLLSNNKNSKDPGDNKEMVIARHNFLSLNNYKPLAKEISNIINKYYSSPITIVDAGVGTGFYINNISRIRNNIDTYLGADISKHAIKIASKENKNVECIVASVYDLPYYSKYADVITCVFSPYAMDEYYRILKDDGILIVASPKENHLIELRQLLYSNVRTVENEIPTTNFKIIETTNLEYSFNLSSNKDISNLLTMTPYVYRAPKESVDKVKDLNELNLTANFQISILKKI